MSVPIYNSVQENPTLQGGDELNSDMSSSLEKPRLLRRGGCHYINGNYLPESKAVISVLDIGLLRGFGVFDFLVTYNNRPFLIDRHIDRLFNSAKILGLTIGKTKREIESIVNNTLSKNINGKEKTIRILITGGVGNSSTEPSAKASIIVIVEDRHFYPNALFENGAKALSYKYSRPFPEIKSLEYSVAIKALNLAKKSGCIEAVYYDEKSGNITEATTSNVFIVKNKQIYTSDNKILFGITRDLVISLCHIIYPVRKRPIKLSDIFSADEVFLTASNKEVMPVVKVDKKKIGNGKVGHVTKDVIQLFRNFVEKGKW